MTQQRQEGPAPIHNAFDAHYIAYYSEQDGKAADLSNAGLLADFEAELVDHRVALDVEEILADLPEEGDGTVRVVIGDVGCYLVKVCLDEE